jgi:hypothetical protein
MAQYKGSLLRSTLKLRAMGEEGLGGREEVRSAECGMRSVVPYVPDGKP